MKKTLLRLGAFCLFTFLSFGQAPEGFKYQTVVRDASGTILANQAIGVQIRILQGSASGTSVYTETFTSTTNGYGLSNLEIGTGTTTDDFSTIDWSAGPYFIETGLDATGGSSYSVMGASQLMSVPYALYAKNMPVNTSELNNDSGYITSPDDADSDPTNEIQTIVSTDAGNSITAGADGGAYYDASSAAGDTDWTISGTDQYSGVTGNVGIGTTTPANKLDVAGKISVTETAGNEMVIINGPNWSHGSGTQTFGDGGGYFMVASNEGYYESAGIYGDGDHVTIWSPGDPAPGQASAYIYVNDEDYYDGATDSDPFNNSGLQAYLNTAGNWVAASDQRRKENIVEMDNMLSRLMKINGYTYNFKLQPVEIEKGDQIEVTYGVIAQEVIQEFPEIVDVAADGSHYVCYTELIPVLIEATKEQQEIIEDLKSENDELKARLEAIESRLEAAGL